MNAAGRESPVLRNAREHPDTVELTARLRRTLMTIQIDPESLRRDVRRFVAVRRRAGASLGSTVDALARIAQSTPIVPMSKLQAAVRQLVYWCVEAHYWHPDIDVDDRRSSENSDSLTGPPP
jgi:hypothetical protein